MIENDVTKSGETFLQTILERSKGGIRLTVKAHPKLEQFMASICEGSPPIAVGAMGTEWRGSDLRAYSLIGDIFVGPKHSASGRYLFRVDQLGKPLLMVDNDESRLGGRSGLKVVNLSFLRLVGISEGHGISFEIRGVHTKDGIRELSDAIGQASRSFYEQFVREYRQVVTVSVMNVPGEAMNG